MMCIRGLFFRRGLLEFRKEGKGWDGGSEGDGVEGIGGRRYGMVGGWMVR